MDGSGVGQSFLGGCRRPARSPSRAGSGRSDPTTGGRGGSPATPTLFQPLRSQSAQGVRRPDPTAQIRQPRPDSPDPTAQTRQPRPDSPDPTAQAVGASGAAGTNLPPETSMRLSSGSLKPVAADLSHREAPMGSRRRPTALPRLRPVRGGAATSPAAHPEPSRDKPAAGHFQRVRWRLPTLLPARSVPPRGGERTSPRRADQPVSSYSTRGTPLRQPGETHKSRPHKAQTHKLRPWAHPNRAGQNCRRTPPKGPRGGPRDP
jgi:hypothetical protein